MDVAGQGEIFRPKKFLFFPSFDLFLHFGAKLVSSSKFFLQWPIYFPLIVVTFLYNIMKYKANRTSLRLIWLFFIKRLFKIQIKLKKKTKKLKT